MLQKDSRVKIISEILNGIKVSILERDSVYMFSLVSRDHNTEHVNEFDLDSFKSYNVLMSNEYELRNH